MATNVLDLCHINIRSLNDDKIDAIKAEMITEYDIICLTETNLPTARVTDLNLWVSLTDKERPYWKNWWWSWNLCCKLFRCNSYL